MWNTNGTGMSQVANPPWTSLPHTLQNGPHHCLHFCPHSFPFFPRDLRIKMKENQLQSNPPWRSASQGPPLGLACWCCRCRVCSARSRSGRIRTGAGCSDRERKNGHYLSSRDGEGVIKNRDGSSILLLISGRFNLTSSRVSVLARWSLCVMESPRPSVYGVSVPTVTKWSSRLYTIRHPQPQPNLVNKTMSVSLGNSKLPNLFITHFSRLSSHNRDRMHENRLGGKPPRYTDQVQS